MDNKEKLTPGLTTNSGAPVDDNQNSITAGPRGPVLLQDYWLLEKLANFNRERIPERIVYAKGSAAHRVVLRADAVGQLANRGGKGVTKMPPLRSTQLSVICSAVLGASSACIPTALWIRRSVR
jgi:hypothetical protein